MNCAEKILEPTIFNLNTKPPQNPGPKVPSAKETQAQLGIQISNHSIAHKLRKGFAKFMIPIALLKKPLSQTFQAKKPSVYMFCCTLDLVITYDLILTTDKCSHPFINNFTL